MVGAVAEFAELVDGLAVAVAGQGARAGGVVEAVHHTVGGEFVQAAAQALGRDHRRLRVHCGQLPQGRLDLVGADLDPVDLAEAVHGAQDPQVGDVVVAPGEIEQPEAVADRERVQIQRPALGHRSNPRALPVDPSAAYRARAGTPAGPEPVCGGKVPEPLWQCPGTVRPRSGAGRRSDRSLVAEE